MYFVCTHMIRLFIHGHCVLFVLSFLYYNILHVLFFGQYMYILYCMYVASFLTSISSTKRKHVFYGYRLNERIYPTWFLLVYTQKIPVIDFIRIHLVKTLVQISYS